MNLKKLVINFILFYRKIKKRNYPVCKFYPSCSEYSIISIEKYGVLKGIFKSLWRILKCNPFTKGGIDLP